MKRLTLALTIPALLLFGWAATAPAQDAEKAPVASAMPEETDSNNPTVLMKTSMGDITLELFAREAPVTIENFLSYANEGFYNGTIFHRVIPTFMIQGGGWTADMNKKETHPPIGNEAANGLSNERGTIAMARTNDPNSATSQFFINVNNNGQLDHTATTNSGYGYCVFGKVIEGMDVVDAIRKVRTGSKPPLNRDVPLETVEILSIVPIGVEKAEATKATAEEAADKTE